MHMTTIRALVIGLLVAGVAACGRRGPETGIDPDAATVVVVDNQAFPDMTIYVYEGARRVRLGIAGGLKQTRFTLPRYLVRTLTAIRFQADPIGSSRTPFSNEIQVSPGDQVTLRIPPA
jgi:predicted small lipoprotein YifL